MDAFIARQPIFDQQKNVFGYELLFRSGAENYFRPVDGDRATAILIDDAVHLHSVEKLTNGSKCFINFTRKALIDGLYTVLPASSTVVEILETVDLDEELLKACRKVRELGYALALDDYVLDPRFAPLMPLITLLKVEFPALTHKDQLTVVASAAQYGFELLAEKVETPEEFERAVSLGYDYFQGYFFCRPQMQRARRIPKSRAQCLRLLRKVSELEFDLDSIEELLRGDLTLSYKLLRYLNSPLFRRTKTMNSIRHAITTLGQQPLRQWVSLIAVEELSSEKPLELMNTCLIRARFCELFGGRILGNHFAADCFVVGMFSLLDAILDQPMTDLIGELNLPEPVRLALLGQASPLLPFLNLALAIETVQWSEISRIVSEIGIDLSEVQAMHVDAIDWATRSQESAAACV